MGRNDIFSLLAFALSSLAFGRELWRTWRDRPRLRFYVDKVLFKDVPHFGDMMQIRILICNVGYRPLVVVGFKALSKTSQLSMGIDDEPAGALGISDQRFPAKIDPGSTLKIHPISVDSFVRNQTNPYDEKVHFSPWRLFIIEDSFGRYHAMEVEDIMRRLQIGTSWRNYRGIGKLKRSIARWFFVRSAKKQFQHN